MRHQGDVSKVTITVVGRSTLPDLFQDHSYLVISKQLEKAIARNNLEEGPVSEIAVEKDLREIFVVIEIEYFISEGEQPFVDDSAFMSKRQKI